MEKEIICPKCGARITFMEGTIVEGCVCCQTKFVDPTHVPVTATVVHIEPVIGATKTNGGN